MLQASFDADFGLITLIFDTDFRFRCQFWADYSYFRYGFWELFVRVSSLLYPKWNLFLIYSDYLLAEKH